MLLLKPWEAEITVIVSHDHTKLKTKYDVKYKNHSRKMDFLRASFLASMYLELAKNKGAYKMI